MESFSIKITARGEEIEYCEGDRCYCFEIFLGRKPSALYAGKYWSDQLPVVFRELSSEERARIVPRLCEYLARHGEQVEVDWSGQ
jgi:hypothetical protein